jgi:ATP-dependent DNA helicase RecQ
MTRAKRSLTVADVDRGNPFRHTLLNSPSVLVRSEKENIPPAPAELVRQYRRLKLSEVFLGFAGYRHPAHGVHRAIAALSPGDILQVRGADERWELLNREGVVVGQLARGLEKPAGMRCVFTTVTAVVSWDRERSEPEYQDRMVCDKWKVVVPELAFEPVSVSDAHRGRFACR